MAGPGNEDNELLDDNDAARSDSDSDNDGYKGEFDHLLSPKTLALLEKQERDNERDKSATTVPRSNSLGAFKFNERIPTPSPTTSAAPSPSASPTRPAQQSQYTNRGGRVVGPGLAASLTDSRGFYDSDDDNDNDDKLTSDGRCKSTSSIPVNMTLLASTSSAKINAADANKSKSTTTADQPSAGDDDTNNVGAEFSSKA